MNRYLFDTNHLSAYLKRHPLVEQRVKDALQRGDYFGITLPVYCEFRAGIAMGKRSQRNLARFQNARSFLKFWPLDQDTAVEFATLAKELRQIGRSIGQFDALIAASARQLGLTVLTADADFSNLPGVNVENWLM